MAHVIDEVYDYKRLVGVRRTLDFAQRFYFALSRGEPLTPDLLALTPNPVLIEPPEKGGMPDMFGRKTGNWFVSEKVRAIIENLEPDIHTFIPVNLRSAIDDGDLGVYYILVIGQSVDAVVIDETSFRDGPGRAGFKKAPVLNTLVGDIVLDGRLISGRHLWRGGKTKLGGQGDPFWDYQFCSDDLASILKEAHLEGWQFHRCKIKY